MKEGKRSVGVPQFLLNYLVLRLAKVASTSSSTEFENDFRLVKKGLKVSLSFPGIQWSWTTQLKRLKLSVCSTTWWQSCRGKLSYRVERMAFSSKLSWDIMPASSR